MNPFIQRLNVEIKKLGESLNLYDQSCARNFGALEGKSSQGFSTS